MPERVRFTLDGRAAAAEPGVSLLAALFDLGLRALRTSVADEPRGPLCAMGTCFECRVTVDGEPHVRACLVPVREGMDVSTCDARPAIGDPGAILSRDSGGAAAGPAGRGAGHDERFDVAVVGAGPAGIAAAVHAAEAGARTVLLDAGTRPGGQIWRHRLEPPAAAAPWLARLERAGARRVSFTTVLDALPGELFVEERGAAVRVRSSAVVLATGARELFLPFPGWTLPGVVGVGAAQALVKAGARFAGLRVLVAGTGPLLPAVAATLAGAGARLVEVAEQAPLGRLLAFAASLTLAPEKAAEALGYGARLPLSRYRTGTWVLAVESARQGLRVTLTNGRATWQRDCDLLACGFGLVPNLELARLLGCELSGDAVATDAAQQTSVPGVLAAGELCGIAGVGHALATGAIAGLAAAGQVAPPSLRRRREGEAAFGARLARAFALRDALRSLARADTIVCRCEDVSLGALEREPSLREAKLHTRAGMGPCQGRVCGSALTFLRGFPPDSTRPPLLPTTIAALMEQADLASSARPVPGSTGLPPGLPD
jgi:NADPH-dependent 2,4-dienoyl-CoA reductase/sulfur reductase-like enzyme